MIKVWERGFIRRRLRIEKGQVLGHERMKRYFFKHIAEVAEGVPHKNVIKGYKGLC